MKKRNLKRIFAAFMATAMAVGTIACDTTNPPEPVENKQTPEPTGDVTAPTGDKDGDKVGTTTPEPTPEPPVLITGIDGKPMEGTNLELYSRLSKKYSMNITASGGVSSMADVKRLAEMDLYAAIIGKAYYTGDIDLTEAIEVAE